MSQPAIEIDAALVARALALEVDAFRRLMDDRKIAVLCERGTGEDAGHYRATFYHGDRRARFVVDARGRPLPGETGETGETGKIGETGEAAPASARPAG